jgi:threonyl-tRNA synthetase
MNVHVSVAGAEVDAAPGKTYGEVLSEALSKKKIKKAVAAKCNGALKDLNSALDQDCGEIQPVFTDDPEGLDILRHSTAHIMAEAVKRLFPEAKVTMGPSIEHGFYYDFDYKRPFTPEDLEAIEAEMQRIVGRDEPFACRVVPKSEAREIFDDQDETYKLEIMDEIEDETVSIYKQGEFTDLCRGPHIPSTGKVAAFKLTGVSGAYWRGDENRPMLQRIYGTAFASPKDLKKHLDRLEEAKRRDHRKLGTRLDLFSFSEDAPGMPVWHPKGMLVRTILEDFERKEHLARGYRIVQGPQILKKELWEKSGHYDNYRENMYFTEIDEQSYGVKPMNCLAHMHIYKSRVRSYRDLPVRYFELGTVHRHEKSGVLHGLTRVRAFTQDDAHILCRPDQLQDEIIGVVEFVRDIMELFGFDYELELSTRPEKSIGSDEDWERATVALEESLKKLGLDYEINEGDGAFYGPKIDIKLKDALERRWQCATVQCDFTLPERFDLVYVGQDGERRRPVMVHRVILGSVERFFGVLLEHFAGAFPLWLAPVQARVLTVTDAQNEFAQKVRDELAGFGVRVEADTRNEKLGYKVREAQLEKIAYVLVVGDKEVEAGGVNVRLRGENLGVKSPQEVRDMILEECQEPFKRGGMSYSFSCSGTV